MAILCSLITGYILARLYLYFDKEPSLSSMNIDKIYLKFSQIIREAEAFKDFQPPPKNLDFSELENYYDLVNEELMRRKKGSSSSKKLWLSDILNEQSDSGKLQKLDEYILNRNECLSKSEIDFKATLGVFLKMLLKAEMDENYYSSEFKLDFRMAEIFLKEYS